MTRTRTHRFFAVLLLACALALPLSGCGKKARPLPPPGSDYPKSYPAGS